MRRNLVSGIVVGVLAIALAYLFFVHKPKQHASILLTNGVVYTANDARPGAEAVAIAGETILAVGTTEQLLGEYEADSTIDLHGRAAYPGFIDAHAHLESLGASLVTVNLLGATSEEEAAARVGRQSAGIPPKGWVRGRGWDQNLWPGKAFPGHTSLDEAAPDNPVVLTRVDGHALWANSRALDLAGVSRKTPDPEGGRIIRDSKGNPTGVLVDNAMDLMLRVLPQPSIGERTAAIEAAIRACTRLGLTQVHDMGVDETGIQIYRTLIREGKFPFRVYAAVEGTGEAWDAAMLSGPDTGQFSNRFSLRALKLYADGALGSRGAALVEPYSDDPDNRGLTLTSSDALGSAAVQALKRGFQVCVHAIGDRANAIVLDVYEKAFKSLYINGKSVRFRVEHAQVLDAHDLSRFKELGVLPSMQPIHCTSDMTWAEERLGPQRIQGAYAWRSLLDRGNIIPAGSDFPVESPNPLLGFYAAITRQDTSGKPAGGWLPAQRMSRQEALKAFTIWGAYAAFQERTKGTLEPGKWADLVILSDDIMTVEPTKIPRTRVELTMIGGQVVYQSDGPGWKK